MLFCPKFVKKVCCDHDALSLNNNKARFRSIEIERHSGETVALPTESRFILSNGGEEFRFTSRLDSSKEGERSSEAYFPLCSSRCFVTRRVGFWVVHSGFAETQALRLRRRRIMSRAFLYVIGFVFTQVLKSTGSG